MGIVRKASRGSNGPDCPKRIPGRHLAEIKINYKAHEELFTSSSFLLYVFLALMELAGNG
jgi:hypothetical protein